jgi:hypothetical protein
MPWQKFSLKLISLQYIPEGWLNGLQMNLLWQCLSAISKPQLSNIPSTGYGTANGEAQIVEDLLQQHHKGVDEYLLKWPALTLFSFLCSISLFWIFKMREEEWFIQPLSQAVYYGVNYFQQ